MNNEVNSEKKVHLNGKFEVNSKWLYGIAQLRSRKFQNKPPVGFQAFWIGDKNKKISYINHIIYK